MPENRPVEVLLAEDNLHDEELTVLASRKRLTNSIQAMRDLELINQLLKTQNE
jgi:hypothetical protein